MGDSVRPPRLPAGAPRELTDFIACRLMEVDIDPAQAAGWIPKPDLAPDGVEPNITPTSTGPNAVSVNVGWGFISITLPVTLSGGQLQVDTTGLPGEATDNWVRQFNDTLRSNNKELSGLEIRNGKIHLTKSIIGAAQPATTPATAPAVAPTPATTPTPAPTPTTPGTTPTPTPTPTPGEGDGMKPGCVFMILMVMVLLVGASITFLVTRGDDSKSSDAKATTSSSGATTTLKPLDGSQVCADLAILESLMEEFGLDDPCQIPDDYWDECDDLILPCFKGMMPLIVFSKEPGITHNGSVPDAQTGQQGPSQSDHQADVVGPVYDTSAWIEVLSRCGNNTITGRSMPVPTGVTSIKHPQYTYGPCRADMFYQTATVRRLLGSYDYTVGDAVEAGTPVTAGISVPTETSLNAVGTTLGLLGGKKLDLNCTLYTADSAALTFDQCPNDRWVFNAGWNDPRVLSYGAGYVNPLGTGAVTQDQISSFGPSRLFGMGSLFPCGPGHLGYTACTEGDPDVDTSFFVGGTVTWATPLDEMPVGTYVEVGFEEYWARLSREADTWILTASDDETAQSRAVLRGNAITFMIPYDEPAEVGLNYTLSVGDSTGVVTQQPQPVLGQLTSTQGPETVADFAAQLSNSFASGDTTFAFNRLHPLVLNAFSAELCQAELALRRDPNYLITVDSVGETAPWTWELPDGRSFDVEAATTATIRLPGTPDPVEAHFVNIDRMYYWFTICDAQ